MMFTAQSNNGMRPTANRVAFIRQFGRSFS